MSANNWARCPKCEYVMAEKLKEAEAAAQAVITNDYGKVEYEKFLHFCEVATEKVADATVALNGMQDTLREDYAIGIDGDEFYVRYSAHCDTCGFDFVFREAHDVVLDWNCSTSVE